MDYSRKAVAAPQHFEGVAQWVVIGESKREAAARLGFCLAACQISMATPPSLACEGFVSICGKVICAPQKDLKIRLMK